jgi:hypothetical protein
MGMWAQIVIAGLHLAAAWAAWDSKSLPLAAVFVAFALGDLALAWVALDTQ